MPLRSLNSQNEGYVHLKNLLIEIGDGNGGDDHLEVTVSISWGEVVPKNL